MRIRHLRVNIQVGSGQRRMVVAYDWSCRTGVDQGVRRRTFDSYSRYADVLAGCSAFCDEEAGYRVEECGRCHMMLEGWIAGLGWVELGLAFGLYIFFDKSVLHRIFDLCKHG